MSFCIRHKQLSINGNFIIRGYSHSIECLKREWLDISEVIFLSCLIGDELRGYFEFRRRTGGEGVRREIPC